MPLVSRSSIEEIRQNVNIYDVASPYCDLKKAGSHFRGLSPFSNEKSPSFFIQPEKNVFKCFSSGHAGDIFRFVQLKENLNFQEAIETLAQRFNIQLKYETSGKQAAQEVSLRRELLDIHEIAAQLFHNCFLANNKEGEFIRDYWTTSRQFPLELAKDLKIGFAPATDSSLLQLLIKKQISEQAIENSGIFYTSKSRTGFNKFNPRFRGRLMIPIRDVQGRVIAFTARQLSITPKGDPTFEAKYINSPETLLFTKGNILFGIHHARQAIDSGENFLLVEGQLDVIRCWHAGVHTALAPQGTAVTDNQLALLKRYSSSIDCLFDADKAGIKAALRLLPLAFKAGLDVSFLQLPEGLDPDTYILKNGADSFNSLRKNKIDSMTFAIQMLAPNGMQSTPSEKMNVFREIMDYFKEASSLAFIQSSLRKAGNLLGLYEHMIDQEILNLHLTRQPNERNTKERINQKLTTAEYQLLLVLLHYEDIGHSIAESINPEWINKSEIQGVLLDRILAEFREDLWQGINNIDVLLENDDEHNCIYSLLAEEVPFKNPSHTATLCIQSIYNTFLNKAKQEISSQIASLSPEQDKELRDLQQKRIKIRKLLNISPKPITPTTLNH